MSDLAVPRRLTDFQRFVQALRRQPHGQLRWLAHPVDDGKNRATFQWFPRANMLTGELVHHCAMRGHESFSRHTAQMRRQLSLAGTLLKTRG